MTHCELVLREAAQIVREMRLEAAGHKGCAKCSVSNTQLPHAPYWRPAPEPAHCADSEGQELLTSSCVSPRKLMVRSSRSIVAHPPVRNIVYVAVERQVEREAVRAGSVVQRELGFGEHDRSGRADELAVLGSWTPEMSVRIVCELEKDRVPAAPSQQSV